MGYSQKRIAGSKKGGYFLFHRYQYILAQMRYDGRSSFNPVCPGTNAYNFTFYVQKIQYKTLFRCHLIFVTVLSIPI